MARLAKILILEGIIKTFPMSVLTVCLYTKETYLRLCPEKKHKKKN